MPLPSRWNAEKEVEIFPLPSTPQQAKCNTNCSEFAGANVDTWCLLLQELLKRGRQRHLTPAAGTELMPLPGRGTEQAQTPRAKPASPCGTAVPSPGQPSALLNAIPVSR